MAYKFNDQERAAIEAARLQSPSGNRQDQVSANGNWVAFYTTLSTILGQHIAAGDLDTTDMTNFKNAKLWLDVATGANGGTGMHNAFIRTYTDNQGQLRRGSAFSEAEMQKASNGVALNLYLDITGRSGRSGIEPWTVPQIDQIADADASSIGLNLFGAGSTQPLSSTDDAITKNSAWSGALGFNLLGGSSPFESWRLLADGQELRDNSTLNTLDDFKNILYAVDSYDKALKAGYAQGGQDFAIYLATAWLTRGASVIATSIPSLAAQLNIQLSSGDYFGFIKDVAARTPAISSVVNVIAEVGANRFLDMLMGAVQGKSVMGTTTEANFATKAKTFFDAYGSTLQTIGVELLPSSPTSVSNYQFSSCLRTASLRKRHKTLKNALPRSAAHARRCPCAA